jgi:hypothetical protein
LLAPQTTSILSHSEYILCPVGELPPKLGSSGNTQHPLPPLCTTGLTWHPSPPSGLGWFSKYCPQPVESASLGNLRWKFWDLSPIHWIKNSGPPGNFDQVQELQLTLVTGPSLSKKPQTQVGENKGDTCFCQGLLKAGI